MEMQQSESQMRAHLTQYANSNYQACTNNSPKTKQAHVETRIKNHISFDKNRTKRQDYPRIRDKPTNNVGIRGRIKLSPVYANIDKPNP
jgi:hypothetical protein